MAPAAPPNSNNIGGAGTCVPPVVEVLVLVLVVPPVVEVLVDVEVDEDEVELNQR
jgi:hypothetical protein